MIINFYLIQQSGPMTKNQKKRLKKKLKKHQELLLKEESIVSDLDVVGATNNHTHEGVDQEGEGDKDDEEEKMENSENSFETDFPLVKIADLGNACWIVSL